MSIKVLLVQHQNHARRLFNHLLSGMDWEVVQSASPDDAPKRYARWIDELKAGSLMRDYGSLSEVADRLRRTNPRLSEERALFLAAHWSHATDAGRYEIAGDPAHKLVNPVLYRWAEAAACHERIECPVLWVQARHTDAIRWAGSQEEIDRRRALLRNCRAEWVEDAGHMLHHDQPARVAELIESFVPASR